MVKKQALTEKQRRFVTAYIEKLDSRAAALAAGYSKRHAQTVGERLLSQRRIVDAIARRGRAANQDKSESRREGLVAGGPITKSWITDELTELYRAVRAFMPTDGGAGAKAPSAASLQSAVKMLELLIKHLEDEGLNGAEDQADSEPDLSRLDRDALRQLEAILVRTVPEAGSAGARRA